MSDSSGADVELVKNQPGVDHALQRLKNRDFVPTVIIDVGAFEGGFGEEASHVWPDARIVLIEANPAMMPKLKLAQACIGTDKCDVISAVVLDKEYPEVVFYQMEGGSGVFWELTSLPRTKVILPATTLEKVLAPLNLPPGPWLVKLDIQGAEIPALCGFGADNWKQTEAIYMETSTIEYCQGSPLFAEAIGYMARQNMLMWDIGSMWFRQTDKTLFQVDLTFVKKDSALRAYKKFWTNE